MKEDSVVNCMLQVINGLKHMHEKGITHRDLKVENIMLEDGLFKLIDFGSASLSTLDYSCASKLQISQ